MTFEALRCFCAVAETGSFREAARQVHRSQPAVSQQLKALEAELGQTLINRREGRCTAAGDVLYQRARRILAEAESLQRAAGDLEGSGVSTPLRIGTSDTTAMYYLPQRIKEIRAEMPRLHLRIVNRSTDAICGQVLRGELDLGIVTLPTGHPELEVLELFTQRFLLVLRADHPLAGRKRTTLDALTGEPFLMLDPHTRTGRLLVAHFQSREFVPSTVLDSGSFEVIKRYVAEGIGVAFLPEIVLEPPDPHLATLEVAGMPLVAIGAIWRKDAYRTLAERAFLDCLIRCN